MAEDSGGLELPALGPGMNKREPRPTAPPPNAKGLPEESKREAYNRKRRDEKERKEKNEKDARKKKVDDRKIINEAVKRFKRCVEAEADNRAAALEDLKFKAGKQWPADVETQRAIDKRPCLTINTLPTFTHQVTNDIRQNRPAINISPLGSESTKESAELFTSLIRATERDSAADIAYDTAVVCAVDIGFGYWRMLTEYEDTDTFNQVIVIARIRNPFTVYLDYARQQPDGSDSRFGFVSEFLDRAEFKDQYPDAAEVDWQEKGIGEATKEWVTKDQIRVAEYYRIEYKKKRLVHLETGFTGFYEDLDEEIKAKITSGEVKIEDEREAEIPQVRWYKLTCSEVLEDRDWAGKWIPIFEVLGEEIDIEGKVVRSGIIRNAKDPMRMKNYSATAKIEVVALAPKSPTLMAEGQDEGYEDEWKTGNQKPIAVQHYVPVAGVGGQPVPPPSRQAPAQPSAGWTEMERTSEQDIAKTTGVRLGSELPDRKYDESGKAQQETRRTNDIGSFHYYDNFGRTLRHFGRALVDVYPKIIDTERFMPIVAEDGTDSRIKIDPNLSRPVGRIPNPMAQPAQNAMMTPQMQPQPGAPQGDMLEPMKVFNPKKGDYGVTVTIGPSYATKRIEAQESMAKFIVNVPEQMKPVVAALMAKYSDWPGSTELFKALAKMLPPGVLMPDQKDLPPAVAAMVANMTQQIQKLMTERMQILRELTERKTDQALAKEKIEKDFEAKILRLVADTKKHMDTLDLKAVESAGQAARGIHSMLTQGAAKAQPQGGAPLQ